MGYVKSIALLLLALASSKMGAQEVRIRVEAAVVDGLDVKRIPRLGMRLMKGDSVVTELRTSLEGVASISVPAGVYRIFTPHGLALNGSRYTWDVAVDASTARGEVRVELASDNAIVSAESKPVTPSSGAIVDESVEQAIFRRVRNGVFRVESGMGHGTGFFVDTLGGVVVTNDHVVANENLVSVYLDTTTRVVAQVVARDRESDLALLRIPRGRCVDCPRLRLATLQEKRPALTPGERVLAIGFPLHQELTLTSGIVSSIRDGAVLSDANINKGNSGGPLLDQSGTVVAINTFGDSRRDAGPGVSGSVSVEKLAPLLEQAKGVLSALPVLEDRSLPSRPTNFYPTAALLTVADTAALESYRHVISRSAANFEVRISTPVIRVVQRRFAGDVVASERRRRETAAGISSDERYSNTKDVRDWEQYVGSDRSPLIQFSIEPTLGESFWSSFARGMEQAQYGFSRSQAKLRVKGDVRGARFYRNGTEVQPIFGGHSPVEYYQNDRWIELRDVADRGYYLLPPELFEPDEMGRPALVTVVVRDLKNPATLSAVDYFGETSARMWTDFAPYYRSRGVVPRVVDRSLKSPSVPLFCSSRTGTCTPR